MSSTLVQFRIDESEKNRSVEILDHLGLSLPSYLRMCMSRLNQENGIPFSMRLGGEETSAKVISASGSLPKQR